MIHYVTATPGDATIPDSNPAVPAGDRARIGQLAFPCPTCGEIFTSHRGMTCHSQRKHGTRVEQRFYADTNGTCVVCKCNFRSRIRLIKHLKDRRSQCWPTIAADPGLYSKSRLPSERVKILDVDDARLRREACRAGHIQPIAEGPALRAGGSIVGRVRR